MSYKIATIHVSGVKAWAVDPQPITQDITGAYVELVYEDPMWDGLTKNVTFRGTEELTILDTGETVRVPSAVVNAPNFLMEAGVVGVALDGEVVIPTLWAELGTIRSGAPVDPEHEGEDEPGVAPIWAQLEAMIGSLLTLQTADKTSTVAAINELYGKVGDNTELSNVVEGLVQTAAELAKADEDTAQALDDIMKEIAALKSFHPIEIKSVTNNVGTVELGVTIDAVTVTWVLNNAPVSQTVDGQAVDAADRSTVIPGPFASDKSFTVTVTDAEGNTASKSTSIAFYNGVYYGVLPVGGTIDSAAILSMTRKLQSGKTVTFTATAKDGEKFAYALPARYGTPKFNVGGFDYDWEKATTIDFTNASGYTESYVVWRAYQVVVGTRKIVVT